MNTTDEENNLLFFCFSFSLDFNLLYLYNMSMLVCNLYAFQIVSVTEYLNRFVGGFYTIYIKMREIHSNATVYVSYN